MLEPIAIAALGKVITPILIPLATKAGQFLFEQTKPLMERLQDDRQCQGALLEYLKAKQIRDKELSSLSLTQQECAQELKKQELRDRRKLSALQRELMRELQAKEIEVKLTEIQTIWDKETWFSQLSRQETEQILLQQQQHLLVLVAPPEMSADCPASFRNNLKSELRNVGSFIGGHYSFNDEVYSIKFYGDYFQKPVSDIDIERLHRILSPIPTIVLYCDINDYTATFRAGIWGLGNRNVALFATQPWNWEKTYQSLLESGYTEVESLRFIRQLIVSIHQLLAAFWMDAYFLTIDSGYQPRLVKLKQEFADRGVAEEWIQPYIENLAKLQQQQLEREQQHIQNYRKITLQQEVLVVPKLRFFQTLQSLEDRDAILGIAFAPEGRLYAGSLQGGITLWNGLTGERLGYWQFQKAGIFAVAISPDFQVMAAARKNKTIDLIHLQTQQVIRILKGHTHELRSVAFSPDGKRLVSGSLDKTVKIWDVETGQAMATLREADSMILAVAFSPDGEVIAGGGEEKRLCCGMRRMVPGDSPFIGS
uniref:WD40 repeat domain-containing protein n=1 Tax=Desertifilum tharense IPPAS B-1220 TaxID=1781255 RepID=A0ACD5GU95_9CYAN